MNGLSKAAYDRRMMEREIADFYEVVRPEVEAKRPSAETTVNFVNGYLSGRWLAKLIRHIWPG